MKSPCANSGKGSLASGKGDLLGEHRKQARKEQKEEKHPPRNSGPDSPGLFISTPSIHRLPFSVDAASEPPGSRPHVLSTVWDILTALALSQSTVVSDLSPGSAGSLSGR